MRSGLPSLSPPEHLAHPVESCILYCTSRRVLLCVICYGFVCLLSAPLFCIRLICLLLAESCSQLVYLIHNSSLTISRSSLHFSTLNLTFSTRPSHPCLWLPGPPSIFPPSCQPRCRPLLPVDLLDSSIDLHQGLDLTRALQSHHTASILSIPCAPSILSYPFRHLQSLVARTCSSHTCSMLYLVHSSYCYLESTREAVSQPALYTRTPDWPRALGSGRGRRVGAFEGWYDGLEPKPGSRP